MLCQEQWQTTVDVDLETATDAMAMTYRAVRESQQQRLQDSLATAFLSAAHISVTLSADLILFQSPQTK